MIELPDTVKSSAVQGSYSTKTHEHFAKVSWLAFLGGLFALSLAVRIWFCFVDAHVNAYAGFDAVGYISGAKALQSLFQISAAQWKDVMMALLGVASPPVMNSVQIFLDPLKPLVFSGPAYPLFLVSSFCISSSPFNPDDWTKPVAAQCFLSAASQVLTALLCQRLFGKRIAICAGSRGAIYPAFIINCGRACTETFACFVLLVFAWLLMFVLAQGEETAQVGEGSEQAHTRGTGGNWKLGAAIFALGGLAEILQLTRSVFILLAAASFAVLALRFQRQLKWKALFIFAAGFLFVALPWLGLQKAMTGEASLAVDRVSKLNFGLGNQTKTQGWAGYPLHFEPKMDKRISTQALNLMQTDAVGVFSLAQDKLPRLFKCGWNDFKTPFGPLSTSNQSLLHQAILLMAALGIIFAVNREMPFGRGSSSAGWMAGFLLILLAIHLSYLPFVAVGRYNLTAMPFLIIFAAYGLARWASFACSWQQAGERKESALRKENVLIAVLVPLWFLFLALDVPANIVHIFGEQNHPVIGLVLSIMVRTSFLVAVASVLFRILGGGQSRRAIVASRALMIALAALTYSALCLPVRAHGRWYEARAVVPRAPSALTQVICAIPELVASLKRGEAYLMVDGDSSDTLTNQLAFFVNGRRLEGTVIPGLALIDEQKQFERRDNALTRVAECIFDSFTSVTLGSNNEVRQWFFIPIAPLENFLPAGQDSIRVDVQRLSEQESHLYKSYRTDGESVKIPFVSYYSWDKAFYGVERNGEVADPRVDSSIPCHKSDTGLNIRILAPAETPARRIPPPADTPAGDLQAAPGNGSSSGEHSAAGIQDALQAIDRATVCTRFTGNWQDGVHQLSLAVPGGVHPTLLVRVSGSYRCGANIAGSAGSNSMSNGVKPGVELALISECDGRQFTYHAPWAPRVLTKSASWRRFDVAAPVCVSAFPGELKRIVLSCHPVATAYKDLTRQVDAASQSAVLFRDLRIDVTPIGAHPAAASYRIY